MGTKDLEMPASISVSDKSHFFSLLFFNKDEYVNFLTDNFLP